LNDTPLKRLHATVSGRVQGVGFRNFVQEEALKLDLTGWVRNTREGDVEVVVEGPEPALSRLMVALRRGPTTGLAYQGTADPRFRRTERLRAEVPIRYIAFDLLWLDGRSWIDKPLRDRRAIR